MAVIVGWIMVVLGLLMVILGVLAWLGVVKVPTPGLTIAQAGFFDLLIALLKTAPWVVVVGLLLIWVGLKLVGIDVGL